MSSSTTIPKKNKNFVYFGDANIDEDFTCPICMEPFDMPVCTPCDHTFCHECIEQWLDKNEKCCPTCRSLLNSNSLKPASRLICNKIDRYLVKCLACDQTNIQRGHFNDHLQKMCSKVEVSCQRADIKCPWKGPKDESQKHLSTCVYDQMRPILDDLLTINTRLNEENHRQKNLLQQLTAELGNMRQELTQMSKELQDIRGMKGSRRRIITFDALGNGQTGQWYQMPELYENFEWVKCWYITKEGTSKHLTNTGFIKAFTHNLSCVILNHIGYPLILRVFTQGETFSLHTFEATSACYDNMKLNVIGRRTGQQVYTTILTLRFGAPKVFDLNWDNIDEFSLTPNGGTVHAGCPEWRYVTLTYLSIS